MRRFAPDCELSSDQQSLLPLTPAVFYILFALAGGERHGYSIMQEVTALSEGRVKMGPGTLYTTIQRLLDLDLIEEVDARGDGDARRRYYRHTRAGKTLFETELDRMQSVLEAAKHHRTTTARAR